MNRFRADLYSGVAGDYDRFRLGWPRPLLDDLTRRAAVTGTGRLLDLACGTGQVALALSAGFAEVWAVDLEPGMVDLVRAKAPRRVRAIAAAVEDLDAPEGAFEVVTIGNAFHRLHRNTVAADVFRWLRPGGHLALLWSHPPWAGDRPWQRSLSTVIDRWAAKTGAHDRIPADWAQDRRDRPDRMVLREAGFEHRAAISVPVEKRWSAEELIGFVSGTSLLPRHRLGDSAAAFERDLRQALAEAADPSHQRVDFAYELFRRSSGDQVE